MIHSRAAACSQGMALRPLSTTTFSPPYSLLPEVRFSLSFSPLIIINLSLHEISSIQPRVCSAPALNANTGLIRWKISECRGRVLVVERRSEAVSCRFVSSASREASFRNSSSASPANKNRLEKYLIAASKLVRKQRGCELLSLLLSQES